MSPFWYKTYLQPAFLICVLILAVAGSGMSIAKRKLKLVLKKEPLPLKKSLSLLDEKALAPYKVLSKMKIDYEEVIEALGTDQYIQWLLEDTEAPPDSPVRYCSLFITYYEVADKRVTHVPDECYMGAGYQRLGSGRTVTFKLNGQGLPEKLTGRYIVFKGTDPRTIPANVTFPVLYLFNVNGEYAATRAEARLIINKNLFQRYSYYCKVEWKFSNRSFGRSIYPSKEQAIPASEKLLSVLLPVLKRDHWPDWPVVEEEKKD